MSVGVFYNPDLVERLAACGITARRQRSPGAPATGFVLRAAAPRALGGGTTHVVANQGGVIITRQRLLLPAGEAVAPTAAAAATIGPRTALELAEDCDRLRRDNQRLTDEVARLRAEVDRLTSPRQSSTVELDDSARRFALIELDL